jgi:hypothetical protein
MGAASAAKKQANEVNIWQQKQKQNRDRETVRQESMRQAADEARQKGVQDISVEDQARRAAAEKARLTPVLTGEAEGSNADVESGGVPLSVADTAMMSGQQAGGENYVESIGKKINDATSAARKRIGAMAGLSSYGGSGGGLGTMNPILQATSGAAIDAQNEYRKGSLGALGIEQKVEPVQIQQQPSPLGEIFSLALGAGAQGLGNKFGNPLVGGGSTLPSTTSIIPTSRPVTRRVGGAGSAPNYFNF